MEVILDEGELSDSSSRHVTPGRNVGNH